MSIYLIGSLRNPEVPQIASKLRAAGYEVFDDWYAAGPEADDKWKEYEQARGHSYMEALDGLAADHVFEFDKFHLDRSECAILVLPAGKSGHLELGYAIGRGKPGYILLDSPDRWDVMYKFASGVFAEIDKLVEKLNDEREVGSVLSGSGPVCEYCEQRSLNKNWSRNRSGKQQCCKCGFQWFPNRNER